MNAWGTSWGSSWGTSWGTTPPPGPAGDCVLSPRSISIQGLGFGARHVALQGFVCLDDQTALVAVTLGGHATGHRNRKRPGVGKRRRRDTDDEVLLFLLRH